MSPGSKLYVCQVLNIIAFSNLLVWLMLDGRVPGNARLVTIAISMAIIGTTFLTVVSESSIFLKSIGASQRRYSSRLSLILKFFYSTIPIIIVLSLVALAVIFDWQLLKVAALVFLISARMTYFFSNRRSLLVRTKSYIFMITLEMWMK